MASEYRILELRGDVVQEFFEIGEVLEWDSSGERVRGPMGWAPPDVVLLEVEMMRYMFPPTDRTYQTEEAAKAAVLAYRGETPPPGNQEPTGAPIITGLAKVGETLTVDTSTIQDPDGLSSFTYDWQYAGGLSVGILPQYVLTDVDEGTRLQVVVSWTDQAGHDESLTSAVVGPIEAAEEPEPEPGEPWFPSDLGPRIYKEWSGSVNEPLPYDEHGFKTNHAVVAVTSEPFSLSYNSETGRPQPLVEWDGTTVRAQWARKNSDLNEITFPLAQDGQTHVFISDRANGTHTLTVDEMIVGELPNEIVCPRFRNPQEPGGHVIMNGGNLFLLSGTMTPSERQQFTDWGLTGQALKTSDDWVDTHVPVTSSEWAAMPMVITSKGDPLDLTGFNKVYDAPIILPVEEDDAPSAWHARVHGNGVGAAVQQPASNSTCYSLQTWRNEPSLRLRLYKDAPKAKGPIICGINQAGRGNKFKPPLVFAAKIALASGNDPMPQSRWNFPGVWVKSAEEYLLGHWQIDEADYLEGNGEAFQNIHIARHTHEPIVDLLGLGKPGPDHSFNDGDNPHLYDGRWFWVVLQIKPDFTHFLKDVGNGFEEIARMPTHPHHLACTYYQLFDMALRQSHKDLMQNGDVADLHLGASEVWQ